MKKLLFITVLLLVTSSYSQIIVLLSEDFTGSSMPTGWNQNEFGTGTHPWTFGSATMPGNTDYNVVNFPNNAAIFNDDAAGNTGNHNYRTLDTPFLDADNSGLYAGADVLVRYHYAINNKGMNGDNTFEDLLSIYISGIAGVSSSNLSLHTFSNNPQYNTINLKQTFVNQPNINPGNFKVLWYFDDIDGSWGWGAGIDDIAITIQALNDACQNAVVIPSLPYSKVQNAIGATNNGGFVSPGSCSAMNDGVWYTFTPSQSGEINISVTMNILPDWDHAIGVYSGSCGSLTCEALADGYISGHGESINNLSVIAGTQYFINIGYYSGSTNLPEHKFLLQIDGNLATSDLVVDGFKMYPNPVKNTLNLSADHSIDRIKIYNMLGQEVLSINPSKTQVVISTSTLQSGSYIVKVLAGNQVGSYSLIKE